MMHNLDHVVLAFLMVLPDLQAFTQMQLSESRSEEIYKIVTQKYPKSVKILRAYVRYLETSQKRSCRAP